MHSKHKLRPSPKDMYLAFQDFRRGKNDINHNHNHSKQNNLISHLWYFVYKNIFVHNMIKIKASFTSLDRTSKRSQLQQRATLSCSCDGQYFWDQKGWHLYSIKPAPFVGIWNFFKLQMSIWDYKIILKNCKLRTQSNMNSAR